MSKGSMEELCERLDARASRSGGPGSSTETASDSSATTPDETEEVREKHKQLLAEIRSCFRLFSIHSRLSGTESPRTRRIATQTGSCESLHSLAATTVLARGNKSSLQMPTEPLLEEDDAQNTLLYNQSCQGSTSNRPDGDDCSMTQRCESAGSNCGVEGGERDRDREDEKICIESIHQHPITNPTSRLKNLLDLSKTDVIKVVEWLYRDHPGAVWRAASREAMGDQENCRCLIYGEISFVAFAKLLEQYAPQRNLTMPLSSGSHRQDKHDSGKNKAVATSSNEELEEGLASSGFTFYDLGCGAGRPVYMASLLHTNCTKSCGIEIVPGMHEMNKVLLRLYNLEVHPHLHPLKQTQQLGFLCGDFLQVDWSDGDILFTNATCFGDPLFHEFEEKATKVLKPGAIVISVTRPFSNAEAWDLLERQERQMSWAPSLVYVYKKRSHSSPAFRELGTEPGKKSEPVLSKSDETRVATIHAQRENTVDASASNSLAL